HYLAAQRLGRDRIFLSLPCAAWVAVNLLSRPQAKLSPVRERSYYYPAWEFVVTKGVAKSIAAAEATGRQGRPKRARGWLIGAKPLGMVEGAPQRVFEPAQRGSLPAKGTRQARIRRLSHTPTRVPRSQS